MKKLILAAFALTTAASVFAQGTIVFNIFESTTRTHVYAPLPGSTSTKQIGNAATVDVPAGTTSWAGYSLIGQTGLSGQYGGSGTMASLLAAPGQGASEANLLPATGGATTTFHTGASSLGGTVVGLTSTFANIPADFAGGATVEVVAWDDSTGLYPSWVTASVAWQAGLIAAGKSGLNNITATIGGTSTASPLLPSTMQSFNLYFVPEPSSFALAGLGMAALVAFRRRSK